LAPFAPYNVLPHTNAAVPSSPPTTSQLSQSEMFVVMAMRDNIDEKVRQSLKEAIQAQYDLTGKCRYLEAWINDLVAALNEHNIDIPPGPCSQFTGTPSSCASD
jgi:hypothetical protein